MEKEITFIINRSEITAGTRGASLGPDAIMTAARTKHNYFFGDFKILEIPNFNFMLDQPVKHAFAKRIEGEIKVYTLISDEVSSELNKGHFPIVLAGDHGSAGGTIAGIKKSYPNKRLGVVWIDAHGDLHTPFTTPSGNIHGMPLAIALNEDNSPCAINEVPTDTIQEWETLKNIGFKGAKILPEDLVFIGVRDTEHQEVELIKRLNIKNFTVSEVFEKGTTQITDSVLNYLDKCEIIYISFDVDSMDPKASSYGTGTPVKNGLVPKQARELLKGIGQSPKVVCIEFVEVNPCLDEKINRMGEITFELIESLVKTLKK